MHRRSRTVGSCRFLILLATVTAVVNLDAGEGDTHRALGRDHRGQDHLEDVHKLVAHEWGTFTTLQDELGRELSGVNIDDEPVPKFVHNLSRHLLEPTFLTSRHWSRRMKGAPQNHPKVTMRLETPVIYFYRPVGTKEPVEVDVRVKFLGGWLTEFYPQADAKAPGLEHRFRFGELKPSTVSTLAWEDLKVGEEGSFPKTDEAVWTTPRKVAADPVTTRKGESERYLFYRGVAHQRSPLRVVESKEGSLEVHANFGQVACSEETRVPAMWLVDVREDGEVAFRELGAAAVTRDERRVLTAVEPNFEESDYQPFNVFVLKKQMWIALTRDGLYGDEALAMLETWNRAYFESPGRRLFYVVPREWTDHYLPLEIPQADRIERVMMGRIELIGATQRSLLAEIANGEAPDASWVRKIPKSAAREKFLAGRSAFGDLGVEIPAHYRKYLALGRFRNALIVEEERRRPTRALTAFINAYGLHQYRWKDAPATASADSARPGSSTEAPKGAKAVNSGG